MWSLPCSWIAIHWENCKGKWCATTGRLTRFLAGSCKRVFFADKTSMWPENDFISCGVILPSGSILTYTLLLRSWNPLEAFGLVSPPEEWFRDTHPVRGLLDSISFDRWSEGVGVLAYLIMLWMQLSQQNCFRVLHATLSLDIGKTTNQSNFVQMPPELICRSVIWTCASAAFFKRS